MFAEEWLCSQKQPYSIGFNLNFKNLNEQKVAQVNKYFIAQDMFRKLVVMQEVIIGWNESKPWQLGESEVSAKSLFWTKIKC